MAIISSTLPSLISKIVFKFVIVSNLETNSFGLDITTVAFSQFFSLSFVLGHKRIHNHSEDIASRFSKSRISVFTSLSDIDDNSSFFIFCEKSRQLIPLWFQLNFATSVLSSALYSLEKYLFLASPDVDIWNINYDIKIQHILYWKYLICQ